MKNEIKNQSAPQKEILFQNVPVVAPPTLDSDSK